MRKSFFSYIGIFLCFLAVVGCAKKEESTENLKLIASLRTAVSGRDTTWLAKAKAKIEKAIENQEMSEETAKSCQEIIELAESGKWSEADELVIDFQKSRRPPSSK